jgi:C-terminal processing protease CtpA/Prc
MHGAFSWYDAGVQIGHDGEVRDVREDSAAWNAGLAPGMQIIAVNDREFSPKIWTEAIADAKGSTTPIELRVKQGTWYSRIALNYHDGVKIPHLERIPGTTDMLSEIMQPRVTVIPSPSPSATP